MLPTNSPVSGQGLIVVGTHGLSPTDQIIPVSVDKVILKDCAVTFNGYVASSTS